MEELIDVLDEFGHKTGQVKEKSEIKKDGDYHRAISVLIINDDKILLQKRSSNKMVYPNLWSLFIKGHVQSGEESIDACVREIQEEIGIIVKKRHLHFLFTIKEETKNGDYIENIFYDTFVLKEKIDLSDILIKKNEVSDIKYVDVNEIYDLIKNNSKDFVPNKKEYQRIFKYLNID